MPDLTPNYFPLFLSVGILMLVSVAILFIAVKEKKLRPSIIEDKEPEDTPVIIIPFPWQHR